MSTTIPYIRESVQGVYWLTPEQVPQIASNSDFRLATYADAVQFEFTPEQITESGLQPTTTVEVVTPPVTPEVTPPVVTPTPTVTESTPTLLEVVEVLDLSTLDKTTLLDIIMQIEPTSTLTMTNSKAELIKEVSNMDQVAVTAITSILPR